MAEPERERPPEDALDEPDATADDATEPASDDASDASEERDDAHLRDVEPGAGCTEIWEHLSENRDD